jgi:CheY-like chemotaxis protein
LGVLAGGIAHDFNNILTAILGNINLFLNTVELEESARRLLSQAERAAIRAADLTKQLLTFSKGAEPVKETASLAEVIRESATFVLRGSKAVCSFSIPDDLWLVHIDRGQIAQVIQNIVLNASQAMPDGGVVEVTCENEEKDQKYVKITVRDSGIGIPANEIDRIFDPYFSTKQEGSGLGLAITYSIIKKHGGRISVQSEPGAGTIFTIYLPLSEGKLEKPEHEGNVAYCPRKARILVMDDDKMVRDVAASMLTKLGHTVIQARDGAEAVRLYEESANSDASIDLHIMDLTVPGGMGGQEAAKKILAINSEARIIASSGYSNDPIIANFRKYGFCSAIVKPYSFQGLNEVVNEILGEIEGHLLEKCSRRDDRPEGAPL